MKAIVQFFKSSLFLLLICTFGAAAQMSWQPTNGPFGGTVPSIALHPSGTLVVVTANGLFRSTDNAQTWSIISTGVQGSGFGSVTVAPNNDFIVASYDSGSLYRSTDLGVSWILCYSFGGNAQVSAFLNSGSRMFALVDAYPASKGGIFTSTDNGNTWSASSGSIADKMIYDIALNPVNSDLYCLNKSFPYRSSDNGTSWQIVQGNLPNAKPSFIAAAPSGSVYLATLAYADSTGSHGSTVYISSDNGAHWADITSNLPNPDITELAVNHLGHLFVGNAGMGIFRSTNNGASWESLQIDAAGAYSFVFNQTSNRGYAATQNGVFASTDNGGSWAASSNGLMNTDVSSIIRAESGILFAAAGNRIFRSSGNGTSWESSNTGLNGLPVLLLYENKQGHLLASVSESGLYKSSDGGITWDSSRAGMSPAPGLTITIRSITMNENGTLFAGAYVVRRISPQKTIAINCIYRSTDNGSQWTICTDTSKAFECNAVLCTENGHIYSGGINFLYRSTNEGASWDPTSMVYGANCLHWDRNSRSLYCGNRQWLSRSTDNGYTWERLSETYTKFVMATCNSILITGPDGAYQSNDGGVNWSGTDKGLESKSAASFCIDQAGFAYAGTSGGVYKSVQTLYNATPAPALLYPVQDSTFTYLTPTLEWNPLTCISSYRVQLATDAAFTALVFDSLQITGSTCKTPLLNGNTIYYWRVSATGPLGTGPWSNTWSFNTMILPPSPPTLTYPADKATGVTTNLEVIWNQVSDATSYHLQVSTDQSFIVLIYEKDSISATTQMVNGLQDNRMYFWRVSASNKNGEGYWSSVWRFTTMEGPQAPPNLLKPDNQAMDIVQNPDFTWEESPGATIYRLQVSTDTGFAVPFIDQGNISGNLWESPTLASRTKYYWRVCARNSGGFGPWSEVWSFTTKLQAVAAPVLLSPPNNAVQINADTVLTWNRIPGATEYRVQVSTGFFYNSTVIDTLVAVAECPVRNLQLKSSYNWHVSASDGVSWGPWSETWKFSTTVPFPLRPTLITPIDGAVDIRPDTTLKWAAVQNASSYQVQVSTDPDFLTTVFDQSGITGVTVKMNSLAQSTKYYWRVNATNTAGTSTWSLVRNFTTGTQTGIADRILPIPDGIILEQNYPNPFTGVTSVRLQITDLRLQHARVVLQVLDVLGRVVETLADGYYASGTYDFIFHADNLMPGVYFYRVQGAVGSMTKKMVLQ